MKFDELSSGIGIKASKGPIQSLLTLAQKRVFISNIFLLFMLGNTHTECE